MYIQKLTKLSGVNGRDTELPHHLSQGPGQPAGTRSPWPLHGHTIPCPCAHTQVTPAAHAHGVPHGARLRWGKGLCSDQQIFLSPSLGREWGIGHTPRCDHMMNREGGEGRSKVMPGVCQPHKTMKWVQLGVPFPQVEGNHSHHR